MEMKNISQKYGKKTPRSRYGDKYSKWKKCLSRLLSLSNT